jgi:hypothetical protein
MVATTNRMKNKESLQGRVRRSWAGDVRVRVEAHVSQLGIIFS